MQDPEGTQDYHSQLIGTIDPDQTIGQTFISRRPRFSEFTIWATTPNNEGAPISGQLVIELYHSINDSYPIYATSIEIDPQWDNSQVDIPVQVQENKAKQPYYISFTSSGASVQLHGRQDDAYLDGNAWINDLATSSDLAFRISYDYDLSSVFDDLVSWVNRSYLVVPLLFTLFFPGWSLLAITGVNKHFNCYEQAVLAVGISLTIIPLVMLWTSIFHIPWTQDGIIWAFVILAGLNIVITLLRRKKTFPKNQPEPGITNTPATQRSNASVIVNITIAIILTTAFFVRLAMVRDLATPAWVDSVHHAMITRLIMEEGGLPSSYTPYMDFNVHNYHTGFHAGLAVFTWLSGLELHNSLLFYGQAINALVALAVFSLTFTYTRKPWAGVFAAIITSFLTPMPAYYTSWGRYTQLTGILVLPIIPILYKSSLTHFKDVSKNRKLFLPIFFFGVVATSGLFLVHYRVLAFALFLLIADFISHTPLDRQIIAKYFKDWFWVGGAFLLTTVFMTSPWLLPVISQIFIPRISPPSSGMALFADFSLRFLTAASGKQSLVLAGIGCVWTLHKKPRLIALLFTWILFLLITSNLDALNLPGGGFITGTSVAIMLFIPISMLGGYFLDEIIGSWQSFIRIIRSKILEIIFLCIILISIAWLSILGARQLISIINPITIVSRQSDIEAIEWIDNNISDDAKILITPFSWGFGLYAGNDGGYWISPLTGSYTLPPPALYGLGDAKMVEYINNQAQLVIQPDATPQDILHIMVNSQIDYIYLGVRAGNISPATLIHSGLFEQVYDKNGVKILKPLTTP